MLAYGQRPMETAAGRAGIRATGSFGFHIFGMSPDRGEEDRAPGERISRPWPCSSCAEGEKKGEQKINEEGGGGGGGRPRMRARRVGGISHFRDVAGGIPKDEKMRLRLRKEKRPSVQLLNLYKTRALAVYVLTRAQRRPLRVRDNIRRSEIDKFQDGRTADS